MKIRVKKLNHALFENTPTTQQPSGQPDTPQVVSDDPAIVDSMTDLAKGEYLLDKKKQYMNILMQLPSAFAGPIDLPDAPLDLYNLMQDINTKKFLNIKDVLKDPKKTFDAAPDIAYKAFGDFTGELNFNLKPQKKEKTDVVTQPSGKDDNAAVNLQPTSDSTTTTKDDDSEELDKLEQAMQDTSTGDTSTRAVADSLVYNYNNSLNESIFGVGSFLGKCFTGATAGALSGGAGFLSGAAGGIAALFGLGYVVQKAFGDVTGNGGIEDDRELSAGARVTSNKGGKGGYAGADVIGAIDWYLKNIGQSINVVLGRITNAKNGVNIVKDINTFATKTDEEVHTYLKANDEIIRKTRENNEQIIKAERDSAFKDLKQTALNKLTILGFSIQKKDGSEITEVNELYLKVFNFKLKDQEKLAKIANLTGATLTVENVKKIVTGKNESINISSVNRLNEEEDNSGGDTVNLKKPDVDFDAYYRKIYEHFSNIMVDLFPARAPEDLPGIKAAKEQMNKLKEGATKEITSKIEQVCRVANSGSSNFATNSDMGTKIASFISKHPMKAATLTNLWNRHEADLDSRIEMRIEQMTNYGDTTHIMGWAANVCQTVVPEVIARMLTYRYALQLLKNNNVYSYTSLQEQLFNKDWENEDQDAFINNIKLKIKYLLANYGKVLSDDGNTAIATINEKNEFALTGVAIPYTIFLLFNIVKGKNRKFEDSIIGTNGLLINNAPGKENLFIDAFINILTLNKLSNLIFEFNKVEELIKLFNINRKNFEHIKKTYTSITQLAEANKKTLNSDNITNTISLLYSTKARKDVPWIKVYLENKEKWDVIIDEYLKDTTNAENKSKVKKLIKGYEKVTDISTMVVNPELFMATTPYDYYSNIICIYKALGLNMVTEYGEKYKSEIVNICNVTEAISKLIITNALLFNTTSTKEESDFKLIIKLYQNMQQNKDENSVVAFLDNLDDGLSNDFDLNELSELHEGKDIYTDETVGIMHNLEENIKNILELDDIENVELPSNLTTTVETIGNVSNIKSLQDLLNTKKIDNIEFKEGAVTEEVINNFKSVLRYVFEYTIADILSHADDDVKINEINPKLIEDLRLISTIHIQYFNDEVFKFIKELKTEFNNLYNKCADEFIAYIENYNDINSIDTLASKIITTLNFNSLNEILNSEITTVEELNNKLIEIFKKYDITNVGVKQLVNKYIDCINTLYNEKEDKWQSFNKLITCIDKVTMSQNEQ